jgi:hypothetical protein
VPQIHHVGSAFRGGPLKPHLPVTVMQGEFLS